MILMSRPQRAECEDCTFSDNAPYRRYVDRVVVSREEDAATATQYLLSVEPTDDAGARTADLFEWQAAMAAADGLGMYWDTLDDQGRFTEPENCRIVCEYHEDWVAVRGDAAELVSAKHKETSFGAYTTVRSLLEDGGLAHLFQRWAMLGERPKCRLVTSPGLRPGAPQDLEKAARYLRDRGQAGAAPTITGGPEKVVTDFAAALAAYAADLPLWRNGQQGRGYIPTAEQRDQVTRFLSMLTIEHSRPSRAFISHAAPGMFVKPLLEQRLDAPVTSAEAVWEAVLTLFRIRMRAAGPRPRGDLPQVLAYPLGVTTTDRVEAERRLAPRTVTLAEIDLAVRTALTHPGAYRRLPTLRRTTRLAVKMQEGGCSDNAIERAEHLKRDYRRTWSRRVGGDPTARADRERLVRRLLRIADEATRAVTAPDQPWGDQLWVELQRLVDELSEEAPQPGLDADLLLGGLCDLADQCKIWFSAAFDVQAAIDALRARQEATS